ncbi:MAG: macro domain-containing protein [Oceanipulchritudo sp.]
MKDRIELTLGDITDQPDLTAIVNAANARLQTGGGVAGAIHGKGDPELEAATRPLAPIEPGEAVLTPAPNLPNAFVIHCLGPRYGIDKPEAGLLENCYLNALRLAADEEMDSVGFPALSTGAFGYPAKEATEIAVRTIRDFLEGSSFPGRVRFVLFDEPMFRLYNKTLGRD